ncbi:unnamed protein product [Dicrocoelium dendriticum]|nr:unnamed protein product [Dicrocoelium dendriticum]
MIEWENAANHLDPVLARACKSDILRSCPRSLLVRTDADVDNLDKGIRHCLQETLRSGKIESRECRFEVINMLEEIRSDLHLNPELYQACALDAHQNCRDIEPGQGRLLTCLLHVLDHKDASAALSPKCIRKLSEQRDLWNYVAKLQRSDSLSELVYHVNASQSRNYVLLSLFLFFSLIFVFGLCCGRVTKRVPVDIKSK